MILTGYDRLGADPNGTSLEDVLHKLEYDLYYIKPLYPRGYPGGLHEDGRRKGARQKACSVMISSGMTQRFKPGDGEDDRELDDDRCNQSK
jgi:hypothetical protein